MSIGNDDGTLILLAIVAIGVGTTIYICMHDAHSRANVQAGRAAIGIGLLVASLLVALTSVARAAFAANSWALPVIVVLGPLVTIGIYYWMSKAIGRLEDGPYADNTPCYD